MHSYVGQPWKSDYLGLPMTTTVVYVVRHGETDANRQEIIQGHLDTHLNEAGLAQAELVASALKDVAFDIAFTSDLSRAARVDSTFFISL